MAPIDNGNFCATGIFVHRASHDASTSSESTTINLNKKTQLM